MREIHGHKINPANDRLRIVVMDEPGQGGASHVYRISGMFYASNDASPYVTDDGERFHRQNEFIVFQNGPISEVGVNGLTQEVLLEIVADRLRSFQAGPFACRANELALQHVEEAQHWLQQRTLERMRRGVEGTNQR